MPVFIVLFLFCKLLDVQSASVSSSSVIANPESSEDLYYDVVRRNLDSVIDKLKEISWEKKAEVRRELEYVLSADFRKKAASGGESAEERYSQVHYKSHNLIDDLDVTPPQLDTLHAAIHHVFSSTTSPSHCYNWLTSSSHTGCLPDNGCKKLTSGVSPEEKEAIVEFHNRVRSSVARGLPSLDGREEEGASFVVDYQPKASRMKEMRWDEELATLAQQWANQCKEQERECQDCRAVPRFKVGQNLYPTTTRTSVANWTTILNTWYNFKRLFDHDHVYEYPKDDSRVDPNSKFYSQMVWDETYLVGCGHVSYLKENGVSMQHLYVCNYGPAGNIPGKPVYLTGNACRRCPPGHHCTSLGLCSYGSPPKGLSSPTADLAGAAVEGPKEDLCKSTCVPKTKLQQCYPSTYQDYACGSDEVCCQLKPSCMKECVDLTLVPLICKPESILYGNCSEKEACCEIIQQVAAPVQCPVACLPPSVSYLCKPNTTLPNAICQADTHVCCEVGATSTCQSVAKSCVKRHLVDSICTPGSIDASKTCPDVQDVCCSFNPVLLPAVTPSYSGLITTFQSLDNIGASLSLTNQPSNITPAAPPCEGPNMECMAKYLAPKCERGELPRELTDTFSCSEPRLQCCAPLDRIRRRLLEIQLKIDLPLSLATGTQCGVDSFNLERTVDSGVGPLNLNCWAVRLLDSKGELACVGALVDTQYVTSTGSCDGRQPKFVEIPWNNKRYNIRRIHNHPLYNDKTLDNDLMVAILEVPVDLEEDKACLVCLRKTTAVPEFTNCSVAFVDQKGKGLGSYGNTLEVQKLDTDLRCQQVVTMGAPMPLNSFCINTVSTQEGCMPTGSPMFCLDKGDVAYLTGHLSIPSPVCHPSGPLVFANTYKPWVITFFGTIMKSSSPSEAVEKKVVKESESPAEFAGCGKLNPVNHGSFRIVCPQTVHGLPVPSNCTIDGRYPVGTQVKYGCDQYYSLAGVPTRVCKPTGEWSAEKPVCQVECGKRPKLHQNLSIGGKKAQEGEWPWQAALVNTETLAIECGGALISESWVMTAAHCITSVHTNRETYWFQEQQATSVGGSGINGVYLKDRAKLMVFLGKVHRAVELDDEDVLVRRADKLVPHPRYNPHTYDADIGLVKLSAPAVLSQRVQIICLSKDYGSSEANLVPDSKGTVAGWGLGYNDQPLDQLNSVELPVVPAGKCVQETIHIVKDDSFKKAMTKDMFCAGYGLDTSSAKYQSVCQGDSGGPIMFQADPNSPWFAEGIVSFYFERGSCSKRGPGDFAVFTKVNPFYQWILDIVTTN